MCSETNYLILNSVQSNYPIARNKFFSLEKELSLLSKVRAEYSGKHYDTAFLGKLVRLSEHIKQDISSGDFTISGAISIGSYNDATRSYDYYEILNHPMNRHDQIARCYKQGANRVDVSETAICYQNGNKGNSHSSTSTVSIEVAIQYELQKALDGYYSQFESD